MLPQGLVVQSCKDERQLSQRNLLRSRRNMPPARVLRRRTRSPGILHPLSAVLAGYFCRAAIPPWGREVFAHHRFLPHGSGGASISDGSTRFIKVRYSSSLAPNKVFGIAVGIRLRSTRRRDCAATRRFFCPASARTVVISHLHVLPKRTNY